MEHLYNGEIHSMNLDSIKMENPYLRLGTDVSTLEKSIETLGLIAPLIVNKDNILLAGARRWQALKNLGYTEAPVIKVEKNNLHQELISIDENLVRKALNSTEMEKHLLRAKEIYKELAGEDETFKEVILEKRKKRLQENTDAEYSEPSAEEEYEFDDILVEEFANEISLKSGLSQSQVIKAMEREEKSSDELRSARERGEVSLGKANELIRLDKEDQDQLLPHIGEKTVGELRKLVKEVKSVGVERALENNPVLPNSREYTEILKSFKKIYKISEALKLEGVTVQGPLKNDLKTYWEQIKENMDELMGDDFQSFTPEYMSSQSEGGVSSSLS